jgi:hypothetical protein
MSYDTALTTSLIDAILDFPKVKPHPEIPDDWECAYCLRPVRDGHIEHTAQCLVAKAKAVKATYRHDPTKER